MRLVHDARTKDTPSQRSRLRDTLLLVLFAGAALVLALPAQAKPGHGPHGRGGPDGWIERHADELGIDDATLEKIEAVVEASREQAETIRKEHRAARDEMRALLDQDEPDRAAVMRQAEALGAIDARKHKHRLATMLDIRALLTPEQRAKLRDLKGDMREHRQHREHHGRHHADCDGKCDGRCHGGPHGKRKAPGDDDEGDTL